MKTKDEVLQQVIKNQMKIFANKWILLYYTANGLDVRKPYTHDYLHTNKLKNRLNHWKQLLRYRYGLHFEFWLWSEKAKLKMFEKELSHFKPLW